MSAANTHITAWGLTSEATPDPTFGTNGATEVPALPDPSETLLSAATVDDAGRLLVAAWSQHGMPSEIVRIQPDGQLDRSFGANGIALGIAGAIFSSLAVDHTGRILAAGALQGPPVLEDSESAVLERFLASNPPPRTQRRPKHPKPTPSRATRLAKKLSLQICPRRATSIHELRVRNDSTLVLHIGARGSLTISWWTSTHTGRGAHRRASQLLLATGTAMTGTDRGVQLTLHLTKAGRTFLKTQSGQLRSTSTAKLLLAHAKRIRVSRRCPPVSGG